MKNIAQLAKEIHANAVSKGFYESEVNIPERFALIHSELSEALEAARADKFCTLDAFRKCGMYINFDAADFAAYVKGTFEDELADVVIRILDLCEGLGLSDILDHAYTNVLNHAFRYEYPWCNGSNIGEFVVNLHALVSDACRESFDLGKNNYDCFALALVIKTIGFRIDGDVLVTHIALKMKYNATRPYKHGKKF